MDSLFRIAGGFWDSLFISPESNYFWFYLVIQIVMVSAFYWTNVRSSNDFSVTRLLAYIFPARFYLTRQFFNDLCISVINFTLTALVFVSLHISSFAVAAATWYGLDMVFGTPGFEFGGVISSILFAIALVAIIDLGAFIAHWMLHKIPFLWELHKVHHSAESLTPVTAFRNHPLDLLLVGNITGVLLGIFYGVSGYFSDGNMSPSTILGINAANFMFMMLVENLQHSHVPISFGKLDRIFISPFMHQVHHSKNPAHADKNLGQIFTIWDRLAGTLVIPKKGEKLQYGLIRESRDDHSKLWVVYLMPVIRSWQVFYQSITGSKIAQALKKFNYTGGRNAKT